MARRRIFNGKTNLNIFWRMLLDKAAQQHSAENERMQAWHAGVKYDFFLSDEGQALLQSIDKKYKDQGCDIHIMALCREAWAANHTNNGIAF